MKFFHADVMLLAVDCRKNRPNDVEVTLLGAGAAFESKWIRLSRLEGQCFQLPGNRRAYQPSGRTVRAVLMQLLANPDPQLQAVLAHAKYGADQAADWARGICYSDEESRTKRYREIAHLLAKRRW